MKKVCIVQARMGSTRLPGKVIADLEGKPVIRHVLERCMKIPGIDKVICAIPDSECSNPLLEEINIGPWIVEFGNPTDLLHRYYWTAYKHSADIVMRVTGDCPLINPGVCGQALELLLLSGLDYASNVNPRGWPQGFDCEVFTYLALYNAYLKATDPYDREHVGPWMQRNLKTANLPGPGRQDERLVIDTAEDLENIRTLLRNGYHE